jgi:hypothetical protein
LQGYGGRNLRVGLVLIGLPFSTFSWIDLVEFGQGALDWDRVWHCWAFSCCFCIFLMILASQGLFGSRFWKRALARLLHMDCGSGSVLEWGKWVQSQCECGTLLRVILLLRLQVR